MDWPGNRAFLCYLRLDLLTLDLQTTCKLAYLLVPFASTVATSRRL